jgi:hypothetical protein
MTKFRGLSSRKLAGPSSALSPRLPSKSKQLAPRPRGEFRGLTPARVAGPSSDRWLRRLLPDEGDSNADSCQPDKTDNYAAKAHLLVLIARTPNIKRLARLAPTPRATPAQLRSDGGAERMLAPVAGNLPQASRGELPCLTVHSTARAITRRHLTGPREISTSGQPTPA